MPLLRSPLYARIQPEMADAGRNFLRGIIRGNGVFSKKGVEFTESAVNLTSSLGAI
jgi:hypothetical protein